MQACHSLPCRSVFPAPCLARRVAPARQRRQRGGVPGLCTLPYVVLSLGASWQYLRSEEMGDFWGWLRSDRPAGRGQAARKKALERLLSFLDTLE